MQNLSAPQRTGSDRQRRWIARFFLWLLAAVLSSSMVLATSQSASALSGPLTLDQLPANIRDIAANAGKITQSPALRGGAAVKALPRAGLTGDLVKVCRTPASCAALGGAVVVGGAFIYWVEDSMGKVNWDVEPTAAFWYRNVHFTPTSFEFETNCSFGNQPQMWFKKPDGTNSTGTFSKTYSSTTASGAFKYVVDVSKSDWAQRYGWSQGSTTPTGITVTGWSVECNGRGSWGSGPIGNPGTGPNVAPKTDTTPAPADPTRVLTATTRCVPVGGGDVFDAPSVTGSPFTEASIPSMGVQIPKSLCPEGSVPVGSRVVSKTPQNPEIPEKTVLDVPPTPESLDPANPCSMVNGGCEGELWRWPEVDSPPGSDQDPHRCGITMACQPETGTDAPPRTKPDECRMYRISGPNSGQYVTSVDPAVCNPILNPDPDAPPGTEVGTNPNPRPDPKDPLPNPYPNPNPPPRVEGETPVPPSIPNNDPAPPIKSVFDCAPSGWQVLNPTAYVYGMGCVLTWAFVPQTTPAVMTQLQTDVMGIPPLSWVLQLNGWWAGIASASCDASCVATWGDWGWDIDLVQYHWTLRPFAFSVGTDKRECNLVDQLPQNYCVSPPVGTSAWLLEQTRPWFAGLVVASSILPVVYYVSRKTIPFMQL